MASPLQRKPVSPSNTGTSSGAKSKQVGGDHYKDMVIQPIEYIVKNNLGYCEANGVKYLSRHQSKGGAQDIRKVIHYCQLILEMQYGEKP